MLNILARGGEVMFPEQIVRKACVTAYCMGLKEYLKVFHLEDDHYSSGKFKMMRDDFSQWFCSLDSSNAGLFMDYVLQKEDLE